MKFKTLSSTLTQFCRSGKPVDLYSLDDGSILIRDHIEKDLFITGPFFDFTKDKVKIIGKTKDLNGEFQIEITLQPI